MAIEIERKFLVVGDAWRERAVSRQRLTQGYLANTRLSSVRVRRGGEQAWVSVKSMSRQLERLEFEYPIPVADEIPAAEIDRQIQGALIEAAAAPVCG